jgi:hypothetical protein
METSKIKINLQFSLIFGLILFCYWINHFILGFLPINPHDTLEAEFIYNVVIGKLMIGDDSYLKLLLNGELPIYFLRRLFHLSNIFYSVTDNFELAFWSTEILKRFVTLFFFFKFSSLIIKEKKISLILSGVWCTLIIPDNYALSLALCGWPYLIYLLYKNKEIKFKNIIIISLLGLNSQFYYDIYTISLLFIFYIFFVENKNWKLFFKISSIFIVTCLIANLNFVYFVLFEFEPLHRLDFITETNLKDLLFLFARNFFMGISFPAANIPKSFLTLSEEIFPIIINSITFIFVILGALKDKRMIKIFLFYITISIYASLPYFFDFIGVNNKFVFLRFYEFERTIPLMIVISLLFVFKFLKLKNFFLFLSLIFILLQFNQSYFLIAKKLTNYNQLDIEQKKNFFKKLNSKDLYGALKYLYKIKQEQNQSSKIYNELWSFNGFYQVENYKYLKTKIKTNTAITYSRDQVLNNMAPILAKIKIADGYYNIYSMKYKMKILKIFENCGKGYDTFNNYGSRINFGYCDFEKLNFEQMKTIGIKYIISNHNLNNNSNVVTICESCNKSNINLYSLR